MASQNSKVIGLAIAGAVGGFLFGFDSSVVNGAIDAIKSDFALGDALLGITVAIALLGCAVGAFVAGRLADRLGRIPVMLIGSGLFVVSAIAAGLATEVGVLIAARVVGGLGIGIASVIAPAYIAEISPAGIRGRLGSLQQLAITVGIFAALLSDAVFAGLAGGESQPLWLGLAAWRWMFLAGVVPGVVYGLIALRLPESPRFLVLKGDTAKARTVFEKYWPGQDADVALGDIQRSIDTETAAQRTGTLRGNRFGLKPIVWIGIILSVFQQFVGINVIFYYGSALWRSVGFSESDALLLNVVSSIVNIATTLVAIATVDKFGRKPLLLIGSVGMFATLATMAVVFATAPVVAGQPSLTGLAAYAGLGAANLYIVFFGMSWGPVMWVMLGEMFNNRIRGSALAVAGLAQWMANFLVSTTFPPLATGIGLGGAYGLYAFFAFASIVFVVKVVQETKGKELEEM